MRTTYYKEWVRDERAKLTEGHLDDDEVRELAAKCLDMIASMDRTLGDLDSMYSDLHSRFGRVCGERNVALHQATYLWGCLNRYVEEKGVLTWLLK